MKGGNAIAAMVDFSGGFSEEYYTKDLSPDELFSTTIETFEKSSLMTCSTATVNELITGLMSDHVYTITRGTVAISTESRNIRPKPNIFSIRLSVSATEIFF